MQVRRAVRRAAPRRCTCAEAQYAKQVVFVGEPACGQMTPRHEADLTLAWCSPRLKVAQARFVQPRAPAR